MSHLIVECPGCLTKLRVRESQTVIELACPRCGEQLAIDPPEPTRAPQPPGQKRAASPGPAQQRPSTPQAKAPARQTPPAEPPRATRPPQPIAQTPPSPPRGSAASRPGRGSSGTRRPVGNQEDEWGTPGYESYGLPVPARKPQPSFWQKYGLLIGIVGGGSGVLMLLLIGGVVWWMTRLADGTNSVVQTTPADTTNDPGNAFQNVPPVIAGAGTPGATNPAVVTPPSTTPPSTTPPAPITPRSTTPFASSGPAPNAGNSNGVGIGNTVVAAVSSESRKLRYEWKPGAEFVCQFSIQEGEGDSFTRTTGVCSYKVEGSASKAMDDEESSGTGFVVHADGILATCAHVVEGAKRMEVSLGGQSYPATVIAVDAKSAAALIRINAKGLPVLTLTDSDSVQLAESVRAIGYPLSDVLGTDVKVTTGTVAGIVQDKQRGKRIQIDASINPGNSGGPVVNGAGQVVGVASAKLSGSSVTSVGFAAPINQLRALAASVNMPFPVAAAAQELAGTEVARRVTPAVAYIRVRGNSGGHLYNVSYTTSFSESQQQTRRMRRGFEMPGRPKRKRICNASSAKTMVR